MHAADVIAGEADAWLFLERLRWDGSPQTCPHCGASGRCYLLRPADGLSRATRTSARTARRVWKCGACRSQFSVLTGTILQGTRVALQTWVGTFAELAEHGAVPSPASIVDRYGVSPETARHLAARLRHVHGADGAHTLEQALRAALRIGSEQAARIRDLTPSRPRPRRQIGPTANYGW